MIDKYSIAVQSNQLARAIWPAKSIWEGRIVTCAMSKINCYDQNFYDIEIPELCRAAEKATSGKVYQYIDNVVKQAAKRTVKIKTRRHWQTLPLFEKLVIKKKVSVNLTPSSQKQRVVT